MSLFIHRDATLPELLATPVAPSHWSGSHGAGPTQSMGRTIRIMNEYEILLMLDAELPEERGSEIITRLRERVEGDGGRWDGHEPWGKRKLAYEIDHKPEGVYHLLLFAAEPATLEEMTRVLKITDGVMRHLAVRRVKSGQTKAPAAEVKAVSPPADDSVAIAE